MRRPGPPHSSWTACAARTAGCCTPIKDGKAKLNAYLDDYANLIDGLTRLYESTGEPRWIDAALDLSRVMIDEFADEEQGGFYYTGKSHEALIARTKDLFDNATPSGNAMAATALLRLGALTGRDDLRQAGRRALEAVKVVLENAPAAVGQSLVALDFELSSVREIAAIGGAEDQELWAALDAIYSRFYLPHAVIAPATAAQAIALAGRMPLLADRPARDRKLTMYICQNFVCQEPVVGVEGVEKLVFERALWCTKECSYEKRTRFRGARPSRSRAILENSSFFQVIAVRWVMEPRCSKKRKPSREANVVSRDVDTLFQLGVIAGTSDGQLLERYVRREAGASEAAFEEIVRRHGPMVLGVCHRELGDRHAAEDAFQATFLVLTLRAHSVRRRESLGPWLHGVAARVARRARLLDRRRRETALPAQGVPGPGSTDPERTEFLSILDAELERLPEKYRRPVVLCYLEGKTQDEAALALGWTKGTVSGRLARAKDLLRARLARRGLAPTAALLGAWLVPEAGAAVVPVPLLLSTVRAATAASLAGMETGLVSGQAAALARGMSARWSWDESRPSPRCCSWASEPRQWLLPSFTSPGRLGLPVATERGRSVTPMQSPFVRRSGLHARWEGRDLRAGGRPRSVLGSRDRRPDSLARPF